ncbi:hypothetical protein [Microbacterium sp. Root180]|uniref:hypothetical protein n=1 Tax=Microbacterium sp. Root180 TaxID=1736483 RepID=UPI0006FB3851|nr:hypothetical protein [Microbacterium sp. Root180]KRB37690.1 hypothetical protein ASD93_04960 [Microbacterium sp. Root180]
MTALTVHRSVRTTPFERMLLTAAAGMDRFVATRLARRGTTAPPISARTAATDARADALAMGAVGMLPR